jgi:hypothetical protein
MSLLASQEFPGAVQQLPFGWSGKTDSQPLKMNSLLPRKTGASLKCLIREKSKDCL